MAKSYIAFQEQARFAQGDLLSVARKMRQAQDARDSRMILLFDLETGQQLDINIQGTDEDLVARFHEPDAEQSAPVKRGRGRPKLGVVGKEVTLLPRHWEWLDRQRGGASAVLRRLIDEARKETDEKDQVRAAQDRTNRFMSVMAGDLPGYEEATRALYASDQVRFTEEVDHWPADIKKVVMQFAAPIFT